MDMIEEAMRRHKEKVFRAALAILHSKADAEDVFLKLFEKQPRFESAEHEAAWLTRVTVNLCKSRLRSFWHKHTVPLLESHPARTGEQRDLMETVARLPAKYRTVCRKKSTANSTGCSRRCKRIPDCIKCQMKAT